MEYELAEATYFQYVYGLMFTDIMHSFESP